MISQFAAQLDRLLVFGATSFRSIDLEGPQGGRSNLEVARFNRRPMREDFPSTRPAPAGRPEEVCHRLCGRIRAGNSPRPPEPECSRWYRSHQEFQLPCRTRSRQSARKEAIVLELLPRHVFVDRQPLGARACYRHCGQTCCCDRRHSPSFWKKVASASLQEGKGFFRLQPEPKVKASACSVDGPRPLPSSLRPSPAGPRSTCRLAVLPGPAPFDRRDSWPACPLPCRSVSSRSPPEGGRSWRQA